MTMPVMQDSRPPRPRVDAAQLWPGGIATAVVAALAALVGVLVCRWLFNIPMLAPRRAGAYGDAHTTGVVIAAAGAAVIATALAHALLLTTPRPLRFFAWIIGLATAVVVLFPFSTPAPLSQKIATAAVNLVIGFAIGSLLTGVGTRSVRPRYAPRGYPPGPRGYPTGTRSYPPGAGGYPSAYPPPGRDYPAGGGRPPEDYPAAGRGEYPAARATYPGRRATYPGRRVSDRGAGRPTRPYDRMDGEPGG